LDDAGFQALTKVMRAADSTYANMEGPIIDESDPNYHGLQVGGPKTIIDDLKSMGIRVMTTANNHTMDGGSEGMFMTNRLLAEARITHAGSGKDLTEAREPTSQSQKHLMATPELGLSLPSGSGDQYQSGIRECSITQESAQSNILALRDQRHHDALA
jgi:poly-gamma-glutamate capsule biosynthesis protein CapA/YwtB (metallophosphatase superfamily)